MATVALVIITVGSVTLLSIYREQQTFRAELEQQATILLDSLEVTVTDHIYNLDVDFLSDIMEALGRNRLLIFGRIYDAEGRIIADAFDESVTYTLHSDPFGRQMLASDTTLFVWQPDRLLAGRPLVVGRQKLGAISVGLSTAPLEAKMVAVRNQGLGVALGAMVVSLLLVLFLSRSITRPLAELAQATQQIAGGDLSHPISVQSGDELAVLGKAMEGMRAELQSLYEGLEQQVAERTRSLQESEARFRHVIASISDHIYMSELAPDGTWSNRYISHNVETLTGYPRQKFRDEPDFWPSLIHPEDTAITTNQLAKLSQGRNSEIEYRLTRANGTLIWVRDSAQAEKNPDEPTVRVYGVISDITERKQAEQEMERFAIQLRTAANISRQLTAILDPDQLLSKVVTLLQARFKLYQVHVYLMNKATQELIIQIGSGDAGQTLREQGHRISLDSSHSLVARAARHQETVVMSDSQVTLGFIPNPLLPDTRAEVAIPLVVQGKVIGVLDLLEDKPRHFTQSDLDAFNTLAGQIAIALENARLFEESLRTAERLRELDRLKSEFLANMSHELRTPLNSIIGYADMILNDMAGDVSEEVKRDVQAIHNNGQHLLHIITDILNMAKLESGRLKLNIDEVPIEMLFDQLKTNNASLVAKKPVDLVVEIEQGLPWVEADPVRLYQVLNNLVANAIKFTDEGYIRLKAFSDNGRLCLEVKDTGIGIPEAYLDKIFDKFSQVDSSNTRRVEGTGLGLAIARHLVEMHGGEIGVRSQVGRGTTFMVSLPLTQG
jgi:PAS domain S-box-containing protein